MINVNVVVHYYCSLGLQPGTGIWFVVLGFLTYFR